MSALGHVVRPRLAYRVPKSGDTILSQKVTKSRQVVATNLTPTRLVPGDLHVNVRVSLKVGSLWVTLSEGALHVLNCVPSSRAPSKVPSGILEPSARAWMRNPLKGTPIVPPNVTEKVSTPVLIAVSA
jgi:hypothetical protein